MGAYVVLCFLCVWSVYVYVCVSFCMYVHIQAFAKYAQNFSLVHERLLTWPLCPVSQNKGVSICFRVCKYVCMYVMYVCMYATYSLIQWVTYTGLKNLYKRGIMHIHVISASMNISFDAMKNKHPYTYVCIHTYIHTYIEIRHIHTYMHTCIHT